jgi:hypothetical protein
MAISLTPAHARPWARPQRVQHVAVHAAGRAGAAVCVRFLPDEVQTVAAPGQTFAEVRTPVRPVWFKGHVTIP